MEEDASAAAVADQEQLNQQEGGGVGGEGEEGRVDGEEVTAASVVEEEEPLPYTIDQFPLTREIISKNISLVARTANGTSHAFTRFELHESEITNLQTLDTFPHIRYIDVSENHLVDIEQAASLEYLLAFNAQSNFISSIPASFDKKKYLQQVNLAKNRLKNLGNITSLPILTFLNLNENKLNETAIPPDAFPELVHLELRGNKLKATPVKLVAPKLQRLYLGGNIISSVSFGDLGQLQVLNLRGNQITHLDGFEKLTSLNYLNLRGNKIEEQGEISKLSKNLKLRIVVFIDNPIAAIDTYRTDIIGKLPKLERIDKEPITQDERDEVYNAQKEALEASKGE